MVMPIIGLEPITHREQILSLSCLPISPNGLSFYFNKRVWINGKLSAFQAEDKGSIPFTRIYSIFRRKGIRTPNLRFWKPLFYHWNYSPFPWCLGPSLTFVTNRIKRCPSNGVKVTFFIITPRCTIFNLNPP